MRREWKRGGSSRVCAPRAPMLGSTRWAIGSPCRRTTRRRPRATSHGTSEPPSPTALTSLPLGSWQGPVASGYGLHLVLVTDRREGKIPPLSEIRDAVSSEWQSEQRRQLNEKFYDALRARYTVTRGSSRVGSGRRGGAAAAPAMRRTALALAGLLVVGRRGRSRDAARLSRAPREGAVALRGPLEATGGRNDAPEARPGLSRGLPRHGARRRRGDPRRARDAIHALLRRRAGRQGDRDSGTRSVDHGRPRSRAPRRRSRGDAPSAARCAGGPDRRGVVARRARAGLRPARRAAHPARRRPPALPPRACC